MLLGITIDRPCIPGAVCTDSHSHSPQPQSTVHSSFLHFYFIFTNKIYHRQLRPSHAHPSEPYSKSSAQSVSSRAHTAAASSSRSSHGKKELIERGMRHTESPSRFVPFHSYIYIYIYAGGKKGRKKIGFEYGTVLFTHSLSHLAVILHRRCSRRRYWTLDTRY